MKPELEVFDTGDIRLARDLIKDGTLRMPLLFQLVMGVNYGMDSTTEALVQARSMLPDGAEWAAFGASRHAFPMLAQAYLLGGHCRVGMEDTVYLDKGVKTPGNAALVEKSVQIIRSLGGQVANVAQAREILGLTAPTG